jgi:LysR family transcriptional regulator, regulator for bpeEF and oprC
MMRIDRLHAMKVFTRVVETSSFTRAAETLGLSRPSVTITVQQLEQYLKVRLLQRTTRQINLTSEGAGYYQRCVRILTEIDEAEGTFITPDLAARGRLRVEMPAALGRATVVPGIQAFRALYPDIDLMLGFGEHRVDLIQDGIDCAIRIGHLEDSSLVARRVGSYERITVASPAYLKRYGMPDSIKALERHRAVHYFSTCSGRIEAFSFMIHGDAVDLNVAGNVAVNDVEAHLQAGLDGIGIVQASRFLALPYLQSGRLKEVLPEFAPPTMPISIVYPNSRHLSSAVRVFIDWTATVFRQHQVLASQRQSSVGNQRLEVDRSQRTLGYLHEALT